jgi:hypothetical protein
LLANCSSDLPAPACTAFRRQQIGGSTRSQSARSRRFAGPRPLFYRPPDRSANRRFRERAGQGRASSRPDVQRDRVVGLTAEPMADPTRSIHTQVAGDKFQLDACYNKHSSAHSWSPGMSVCAALHACSAGRTSQRGLDRELLVRAGAMCPRRRTGSPDKVFRFAARR